MTLAGNILVLVSALPLIWRTVQPLIPPQYIESYAYWDAETLNDGAVVGGGRTPRWRNMGYWTSPDETFTQANVALAERLLFFSDAKTDGRTLDIGFGGGETLLMHLAQGAQVTGLTTLPSDVLAARQLISTEYPDANVDFYTGSATFTRGKDLDHPLNPERLRSTREPVPGYDLIYALDVAYHIPPTVLQFAADAHTALSPKGVLAYTDVLPPAWLGSFPGRILGMWLALPLGLPHRNIIDRPRDLDEYKSDLEGMGYDNVRIEDWSKHVWNGLADNLEKRDGLGWKIAAKGFRYAGEHGWRFIAVRGEKGVPPQVEEIVEEQDIVVEEVDEEEKGEAVVEQDIVIEEVDEKKDEL